MAGSALSRLLVPVVLLGAGGGLVALGFQFRATDATSMAADAGSGEVVIPSAPPVSQPVEDKTDAFTRPMFHRDRQPGSDTAPTQSIEDATAQQAADQPESDAESFVLKGVIIGGRGPRAAIATDNAAPVWVKVGDKLQGWTVQSISSRIVKISNGDDVAEIKFQKTGSSGVQQ